MNRQARRAHQAGWLGAAAGVASLAVIVGLAVAGTATVVTSAAASVQAGVNSSSTDPNGGISVPID
jgi:hypothetical protein